MTLQDRLQEDMKAAMRAGDTVRLSTIRMLRAAIKNREIAQRRTLQDPEVLEVIGSLVKQRREAIAQFTQGGRGDLVERETRELNVLLGYLPEPLSEAELSRLAQETVQEIQAQGMKDLGRVMKALMPKVAGRAEGKRVHEVVKTLLSGS